MNSPRRKKRLGVASRTKSARKRVDRCAQGSVMSRGALQVHSVSRCEFFTAHSRTPHRAHSEEQSGVWPQHTAPPRTLASYRLLPHTRGIKEPRII